MAVIGSDFQYAKQLLDSDQLVAIPTETVYGLAGKAFSKKAVLKIFKAKNRPSFDPLIAHSDSIESIEQFVDYFPEKAKKLAEAFWPGALTLLLPKNKQIPDIMTSGLSTVAVRIPAHEMTLSLLQSLQYPLAAPSANPFGYVSPTTAQHVENNLGDKIPYILDGGSCSIGVESTIVGFENDQPIVYRLGGLKIEQIEEVVGKIAIKNNQSSNPKAPGMVKSHYAPGKPIEIVDIQEKLSEATTNLEKTGFISFGNPPDAPYVVSLSDEQNLEEAAFKLFSALRYFDTLPVDKIYTQLVPNTGIGRAINDRLQRAAAK
ncbi:MAG: L-threonylcarbamoyladenylate synthase [Bacteroidota bacterium]